MEPIAIIGIGCRFPKAKDPESFWQLLSNGVDAITEVPNERWDINTLYNPKPTTPGKMSTRWGGFLDMVDQFDSSFFRISPREAERMDPQQRLVLEVAWESIENAGITPKHLSGSKTGVFIAIGNYDYGRLLAQNLDNISAYDGTGSTLCIAANRLSYLLNLRGPSVVVETACSSSLVALHYACQSLYQGESNLCLVGGVSLILSPEPNITYSHAGMMASDGRCKTFDASADGYVRGEGCGVVVLKRLKEALEDGDIIQAVIKGSAINQDGTSNGLTAPNGLSQKTVYLSALKNAGVTPAQISYVEAHGTGTALGDPIEFNSLKAVYMQERESNKICWLGSAKTNIGHLEAASGMASLIKVVLALQHKKILPHLHLKQLNPYISLEGTTFSIPRFCQPWSYSGSRLAGVSAFGFGGTNCHVILEEAPSIESRESSAGREAGGERPLHLLTLSAKTETSLRKLAQSYADFFKTHPQVSVADVCFTASTGRSHFDHRMAVLAQSSLQLQNTLSAFASGEETTGLVSGQVNNKKHRKIAFLFTGQGSQYVGMGRQLYETHPIFRQTLDRCAEILRPYLEKPLLEVLYPEAGTAANTSLLDETVYTQPALFALEYALFQLWKSWGIEPTVVMGHSVGEYVAACVAGVFSLEDGLKLIAERGRLMQALPPVGEMIAVFATETTVQAAIQPYADSCSIAAINGSHIVISGERKAVEKSVAALKAKDIKTKKLQVSHGFHSPLMEPMLSAFEQVATNVTYSEPKIKLISNITGELTKAEIATPEYWCRHVRQPVRFAASIETLYHQGCVNLLEIGPKPILSNMSRYCLADVETSKQSISSVDNVAFLSSLSSVKEDWQQILQSLATLYVRGVPVNWSGFDLGYLRRRLQLPTYPFERQRYWLKLAKNGHQSIEDLAPTTLISPIINLLNQGNTKQLAQHLATAGKLSETELQLMPKLLEVLVEQHQQHLKLASINDWFYEIEWQLKPYQLTNQKKNKPRKSGIWLIFADRGGVGYNLAKRLRLLPGNSLDNCAHHCILVYPGEAFECKDTGTWFVNPSNPEDFELLYQQLSTLEQPLQRIVHLWSLDAATNPELSIPALTQSQRLGVGSVLHLLQALVKNNTNVKTRNEVSPPQLWLITRGAVPVGSSLPAVAQAPVWGLGKVIALEHPELWGRMLDLSPQESKDEITTLLAELQYSFGEDHLAFRNGQRYVARLVPKQLPQFQTITFSSDGTYLITGGLGALGLKVAQWLVKQGAGHLVLTSRRSASYEVQKAITQMEHTGAKVIVAQADVTNEGDMARVFEQIKVSMPPLRGIIHAAGVPGYEALKDMEFNTLECVLRPKVIGTWLLHQLSQEIKLDFFVSFSSIASVWGSKGQAHYAAANYFLDILAHYRQGLKLPALSVNWGPWAGGGMALTEFQTWMSRMGVEALEPEQAVVALGHLLGTKCVQKTVAKVDWTLFKGLYEARRPRPLLAQLPGVAQESPTQQPQQSSEILRRLEATESSKRYSLLVTYLQSEVAKVLRLEPSQLPEAERNLFDMGMDSIMAVELVNLIKSQLQIKFSIVEFMQAQSIATIAALLLKQLAPEPDVTPFEAVENKLNLNDEAVLDESIYPDAVNTFEKEIASILLTGASGFLGAFLLKELLEQTEADIYCVVRASDASLGMQKIYRNLEYYSLWQEKYRSKIIPIIGDLSQPQLGLSTQQWEKLATQIDVIYHNGAVLNFVYPYSALKPTNVLGTQEILKLACQAKVKPLHYVSTDAVFDSSAYYSQEVKESDAIIYTEGIDLGYTQTKWVAEKLVTIARERGLPVSIYRPPLIAGDSRTGIWNTDDFTCRFLKGCIQMGSIPQMNCSITIVPVDYVSQAIIYLSRQKESQGKAFHLNNPHDFSWSEVANWIDAFGYKVRQIPYEEWEAELIEATGSEDNALSGLVPFFLQRWSEEQLNFSGLAERRVKLNCQETIARLADTSITCPRVDSQLLSTYFSYFINSGFLDISKTQIQTV